MARVSLSAALLLLVSLTACDRRPAEPTSQPPVAPAAQSTASSKPAQTTAAPAKPVELSARLSRPAADRIVAIGDLHGDLSAARTALKLGGAIDASDNWIGGKLVVVQTGDVLDRGDGERAIMTLLDKLGEQARAAGGDVVLLSGNHELMNVSFDFRYVTPGGYATFEDVHPSGPHANLLSDLDEKRRGRAAAFVPGGPYALKLAERPLFVRVGENVFVHGGILPKHVSYGLEKMNDEVRAWVSGSARPPASVLSEDGPVWTRAYSTDPSKDDCAKLSQVLTSLGAKRMVVGHTPQRDGITSGCDEKVWRIDTGMSRFYGGPVQALLIEADKVTVLKPAK